MLEIKPLMLRVLTMKEAARPGHADGGRHRLHLRLPLSILVVIVASVLIPMVWRLA